MTNCLTTGACPSGCRRTAEDWFRAQMDVRARPRMVGECDAGKRSLGKPTKAVRRRPVVE